MARLLTEYGHQVHAVSLSGLADVPHDKVGLATHVSDVHDLLAANDLREVILVGHSYAGIVTGQVADQAPDWISLAVYVDAKPAPRRPCHDRHVVGARQAAGAR
ncbi:alpha/beta hydrolase [Amycolatopsis sp. AA4]|nr:alpha/beta hydrolase [Amycolatopsis sp. AA4]